MAKKVSWTPQQLNAINARGRNILVSAAAGSGKTAVLVERVIKMITDYENPIDVDKLLIVTFTNAAAAEMKYRISDSLNKKLKETPNNKNLRRQLSLLPNANICTIDSFCINLVRENFYSLSINRDFTTLEDSEAQLLEDSVIDTVIDKYFDSNDSDFVSLIESFTTPNTDKPMIEAIKKLLRFIYAQPFPYIWLDKMVKLYDPDTPLRESVWYNYISDELDYLFSFAKNRIDDSLSLLDSITDAKQFDKFSTLVKSDLSEYFTLKSAYDKSFNDLVNANAVTFMRMPASTKLDIEIAQKLKANRNIYKSILTSDIPALLISDEDEYKNDMKALYPQLKILSQLVKETDSLLYNEKLERNAFTFSDIEHFAISLLFKADENGNVIRTELAENLSKNYAEILVDEYQDTNEAQDMLFTYLSNGHNLFTVGDIKQSIYRFRLAMPHIFNEKKKKYLPYDENDGKISSKIILDKNFRSRSQICSYVNFVFKNLMTEKLGELHYNEEEFLNHKAEYKETEIPSAQIKIIENIAREDTDKSEAAFIAKTIEEKVKSGELIKDKDTYRPIRYGDFAILMRSLKSHIDEYASVLTEYKIPVICDNSTNLFDNNEIKLLLSLLRTIDNPTRDIPLLAVMISPIYGFTADELAQIRLNSKYGNLYSAVSNCTNTKCVDFINDISNLRKISVTMSVSGFIRFLVEEKGIIAFINAMGNGEQRYQNVLKLITFAQKFDNGPNVGLTAFMRYIDKIIESEKTVESASVLAGGEDAVTIMSIHHSKGLEFPVCILAGAAGLYNKRDLSDKLLLNSSLGVGIKRHNEKEFYQYQSLPYAVIKNKSTSELMSENLRVLYVAMTRAKEQFITFISCSKLDDKLSKLAGNITDGKIEPYICKKAASDADFLLMCALIHPNGSVLRDRCGRTDIPVSAADFSLQIDIADEITADITPNFGEEKDADESIIEEIRKKLSYSYSRRELSNLSGKLTASSLDEISQNFDYITSSKPAFMSESALTPAQKGSAMHLFMQFCNYENAKASLENEIQVLEEKGYINKIQADSLDRKKLSKFFTCNFADRMFKSDKIYREIKVSSFVRANELYDTDFDDDILVQGIADCVFEENGNLILVDYKTDNVKNENELLDRYKNQIEFYKNSVSKTLEKPVTEAVLYSFALGKICRYK